MRTLFAVAVLAGISLGQDPLEMLASEQPVDQAWGAYRAGEQQLDAAVPALRELLKSDNAQVRWRVLDALVRLEARVGWQELEPLFKSRPNQVLILLATHPVANRDALLRMVAAKSTTRLYWVASCNVLATKKDPGLAAVLLDGLKMELQVTVVDGENIGLGGGCGRGFRCGRQRVRVPEGWPPLAVYKLTEQQGVGAHPFAPGPHPVFYTRHVYQKNGSLVPHRDSRQYWRNGYRFEYLAHLLDQPKLPIDPRRYEFIQWAGVSDFTQRSQGALKRLKAGYGAVLDSLVEKKLLDPAARPKPDIKVVVHDQRENAQDPLPQIS